MQLWDSSIVGITLRNQRQSSTRHKHIFCWLHICNDNKNTYGFLFNLMVFTSIRQWNRPHVFDCDTRVDCGPFFIFFFTERLQFCSIIQLYIRQLQKIVDICTPFLRRGHILTIVKQLFLQRSKKFGEMLILYSSVLVFSILKPHISLLQVTIRIFPAFSSVARRWHTSKSTKEELPICKCTFVNLTHVWRITDSSSGRWK